ncbi:hypothetical protein V8E53_005641 [Lactarius tabidus]
MTAAISKGTLNLRFMQNAQNTDKNLPDESMESLIQDESRWEVAKEVRDAWGMGSEPLSSLAVIHEASYLPFVFSDSNDASGSPQQAVKLRGRRTWNKRGQEVTEGEHLSHDDSRGSPSERQVPIEEGHHPSLNPSKRLTSISSFGPRSSTTKDFERSKPRNTKSAREIIREDVVGGSGIKIRSFAPEEEDKSSGDGSLPSRTAPPPPPSAPSPHKAASSLSTPNREMFLKPAGVDEPSDSVSRGDGSRPARPEPDTTRGTRRPNLKRDRDDRRGDDAGARQQSDKGKRRKSGAAAA